MFRVPFKSGRGGTTPPTAADTAHATLVLDVRTREEFAQAHVPGARNIPVQELALRHTELGEDKHAPVVLYCRSGARSALATRMLREQGFTNLTDIGPMGNWDAYRAKAR